MRITTTLAITTVCLALVGCNHLNRDGSKAMMFDKDPFLPTEQTQRVAATTSPTHVAATMPSGDRAFDPASGQPIQPQYHREQTKVPTTGSNIAQQFDIGRTMPNQLGQPVFPAAAIAQNGPGPAGPTSPAMRAEAEVAAMLAQRHAQPNLGIQQTAHHAPAEVANAGTARFDYSAGGPAVFEPNPFANDASNQSAGIVQAAHEQVQADAMPMLTPADLEVPADSQQQPNANVPGHFPGAPGIPMPTGRAFMFSDKMVEEPPASLAPPHTHTQPAVESQSAVPAQPTFAPPTRQIQTGQVPNPVVGQAIPLLRAEPSSVGGGTATPQPSTSAEAVSAQPVARPIIRDSRSDSKWRAKRRM